MSPGEPEPSSCMIKQIQKYSLEDKSLTQTHTCSVSIETSLSRERQPATTSCPEMERGAVGQQAFPLNSCCGIWSALLACLQNSLSGIQNCSVTKQCLKRNSEPDNSAYRQ